MIKKSSGKKVPHANEDDNTVPWEEISPAHKIWSRFVVHSTTPFCLLSVSICGLLLVNKLEGDLGDDERVQT